MQGKRAQTSIEYLLLMGGAIVFIAVVTLATRSVIVPTGEQVEEKGGNIATSKATFGATATSVIIPSTISCTPGAICGTFTVENTTCPSGYALISSCTRSCTRTYDAGCICQVCDPAPCTAACTDVLAISNVLVQIISPVLAQVSWDTNVPSDGKVDYSNGAGWSNTELHADLRTSHSLVLPAFTGKAHTYTITSSGGGLSASTPPATFDMPFLVFTFVGISGITEDAASVHWTTNYQTDADTYKIGKTSPPVFGITTASSNLDHIYQFVGLAPGTFYYTGLISGLLQPDGSYFTNETAIENFTTLGSAVPPTPPSCILSSTPDSATGSFSSLLTATFADLEASMVTTQMRCSPADAWQVVDINPATKTATRSCGYPQVFAATTFTAMSNATNSSGGEVICTKDVTDDAAPLPACVPTNCELSQAAKPFYDFVIRPQNAGSPETITVFNDADICNDLGGGVCEPAPCRVRGSQAGEAICTLVEDWTDFDWNDFVISTRRTIFSAEESMLDVTLEECDTAAKDELTIKFGFSSSKNVMLVETGEVKAGTSMDFIVWPQCQGNKGDTRQFYISDIPISNTPPVWQDVPNPRTVLIGQGIADIDLWNYVSDETPDLGMQFALVSQSDPAAIPCSLLSNRYLSCGPAAAKGKSSVWVVAMDPETRYSWENVVVSVGLQFDLPPALNVDFKGVVGLDMFPYVEDPVYDDNLLNYTILSQSNITVASCDLPSTGWLRCVTNVKGFSDVAIRVNNNDGDAAVDTMRLTYS